MAHPLMLRAIAASKKKNDRVDAAKISGSAARATSADVLHGLGVNAPVCAASCAIAVVTSASPA